MHVITRRRLNEFAAKHPGTSSGLARWYRLMKSAQVGSFAELKRQFAGADKVGKFTVFNISGNHARLIAAIHYSRGKVYVRHILTHHEYDLGKWKE